MNKQEAKEALVEGKTLTHRYFSDHEYVFMNNSGKYETEDGVVYRNHAEFWDLRQDDVWDCDWKEFKK